ncbi:uncharacterized protein TNCV_2923641 [Trichonephila clavipes]|nr:uncharacterized protein TNCV_2923641 [Trichonephila clavipes]
MKTAIYATLFHRISTDQKPQHFKCPTGKDSWCFFQVALARGEVPCPHVKRVKTPLKETHLAKTLVKPWAPIVLLPTWQYSMALPPLSSRLNEDKICNDSDIINNLIDYEDEQEESDSLRVDKNMQGSSFPT